MRFHILCFLAFCAPNSQAFVAQTLRSPISAKKAVLVRHSTAPTRVENSWSDTQDFNIALDKIAEQCGNSKFPVISKAAECQEMWEKQQNDEKVKPDTISFNTVLKAWNRCCNTLSESTRNHKTIPSDYKYSVDVYTPRDAAKKVTSLLIEQTEPKLVDVASYNIVIGKKSPSSMPWVCVLLTNIRLT